MKQIVDIILKALRGQLSKEESESFREWLSQSEKNASLYERLSNEQYVLEQYELYSRADSRRAWNRVKGRQRRRVIFRVVRYAACLLVIVGMAAYFLNEGGYFSKEEKQFAHQQVVPGSRKAFLVYDGENTLALDGKGVVAMRDSNGVFLKTDSSLLRYRYDEAANAGKKFVYHTLVTERGGEYGVVLADGTKVFMNSETKLRYPSVFNQQERRVYLEGEAYFEVSPDKEHPFIVEGRDFSVRVLGTSFNVSNYQDNETSTVVLVNGSVQVDKDEHSYALKPNEKLIVGKDSVLLRRVNATNAISWRSDKFYFYNESLEMVMKTLVRWYDVEVVYANQRVKDFHFTGFIPKYTDIGKAFEVLELTCNIKFVLKDRTVIITQRE